MTDTLTKTSVRVTVHDGWAVRDLADGSQVRARLELDPYHSEPERGPGTWNEGVTLVRYRDGYNGIDLDEHDGMDRVLSRIDHDGRYWWVNREGDDQERMFEPGMSIQDYWTRCEHGFKGGEVEAWEFVSRYLRAFHDVQYASLRHHSGHSQSDWSEVWVLVEGVPADTDPEALADSTWTQWDAWAKGDVYSVESQTRTLAEAIEADPDDPDDGWVDSQFVGGYYGDDEGRYALAEALGVDESDVPAPYEVTRER